MNSPQEAKTPITRQCVVAPKNIISNAYANIKRKKERLVKPNEQNENQSLCRWHGADKLLYCNQ